MSFGFGFSLPNWQTLSGGFTPASLFAAGEVGAWYDPSDLTTLFQDSAGTTPVTAVEQSVGLMLDKRVPAGPGYYSGGFDASNDSLTVGTVSSFNFMHNTTALFTFECWVNVASTASAIAIADNTGATTSQTGFFVVIAVGGAVQLGITNSNGIDPSIVGGTSSSTVSANTWTHIAVTYDQSLASANAKFYINGVAAGTLNKTAATPSSGNASQILRIGQVAGGANWFNGYISNLRITNSIVYTGAFTPSTTPLTSVANTQLLTCQNSTFIDNSPNNFTITANGGIVPGARNPFGNHAYQSTSTSRPVLRARYNLLTYSEQFDNGAWTKVTVTVSADAAVAPDGTTTADQITLGAGTTKKWLGCLFSLQTYQRTYSFYAKYISHQFVQLLNNGDTQGFANFDIQNGIAGTKGTGVTSTIQSVGNGWYRCTVTHSLSIASEMRIYAVDSNSAGWDSATSSTGAFLLWGAQLIVTNSLLSNAYQRIAAATDYNTSGFLPYLSFDGTDDSLLTNSVDFTATDKMTVWAGVRKLSDPGDATLVELSATVNANNGSFGIFAPSRISGTLDKYAGSLRGTTQSISELSTYAAPITNVLSAQYDIAGATIATESIYRVNAATPSETTNGVLAGTGNFGNYPLYIGRRNNATLPFNGNLYSLIIRGAQSSAAQISSTESWVNGKTGAY
jgi:hypothetical protein